MIGLEASLTQGEGGGESLTFLGKQSPNRCTVSHVMHTILHLNAVLAEKKKIIIKMNK